MTGVSYDDYIANQDAYKRVFEGAVLSVTSLPEYDCIFELLEVFQVSRRRALTGATRLRAGKQPLAGAVDLEYTVTIPSYTSRAYYYTSETIRYNVERLYFTHELQRIAREQGVTGLYSANSNAVTLRDNTPADPDAPGPSSGSDSSSLSVPEHRWRCSSWPRYACSCAALETKLVRTLQVKFFLFPRLVFILPEALNLICFYYCFCSLGSAPAQRDWACEGHACVLLRRCRHRSDQHHRRSIPVGHQ